MLSYNAIKPKNNHEFWFPEILAIDIRISGNFFIYYGDIITLYTIEDHVRKNLCIVRPMPNYPHLFIEDILTKTIFTPEEKIIASIKYRGNRVCWFEWDDCEEKHILINFVK